MSPEVERLKLQPDVAAKAEKLLASAPGVVFVSGRRTYTEQARAMSQDVALVRDYIRRTYVSSHASRACQQWVDAHPEATSVDALTNGLLSVLMNLTEQQAGRLSKHLTGRAFDCRPGTCTEADILALHPTRFLMREAGLARWHVQF